MLNACILLKVVPTRAESILEQIKNIKRVRKAYLTYGRFDVVVFVEAENYKDLQSVTTEINCIEGVRSTETLAEA